MTWQPTEQQIEDAALAGGINGRTVLHDGLWAIRCGSKLWCPVAPTKQGKADLQDLQLAIPLDTLWVFDAQSNYAAVYVSHHDGDTMFGEQITITNNDKHAALAQAALEVAAMVGAKMKGTPC